MTTPPGTPQPPHPRRERRPERSQEIPRTVSVALEAIARKEIGVPTLSARGSDPLDMHRIRVGGIKAALEAAFRLGLAEARRASEQ